MLDESAAQRGVLSLDQETQGQTVRDILKKKHPDAQPATPDILMPEEASQPPPVIFDNITEARRLFYLAVIQLDLEYAATATIPFLSISLRDRLCSVWSALCCRVGLASRSCPNFENSSFNINRTSLDTPVCCCSANSKMCSKIGSSLSVHKTKFYRTFSSNQGKRKFSSTILSLLSARHALIY